MSDLHVLHWGAPDPTQPVFGLYHARRLSATGEWTTFGDVFGATDYPKDSQGKLVQLGHFTCAVDPANGDLHVCGVDGLGNVWHTIRNGNSGEWSHWRNATEAAHFHRLSAGGVAVAS